ncbi:carbamoyltransferase N-terminal domain-containing protein [Micromonospora globbae]|uniref:carbamoyltransferase N-terminal domain-containing protein n=1 Tax=Micromonospora globbae TaxID=1894969 RepID=UPI0023D96318|nr:carbamoyltransferase N-terminal domain-containing protein [Micromonospora globbae]
MTGSGPLCLGGRVAMNCVAAGLIAQAGVVDEVHVPPAPGDSGAAIGAAAAAWPDVTCRPPTGIAHRCYLGPAYPGLTLPAAPRPGLHATRLTEPTHYLARRLAEGEIVGLFTGELRPDMHHAGASTWSWPWRRFTSPDPLRRADDDINRSRPESPSRATSGPVTTSPPRCSRHLTARQRHWPHADAACRLLTDVRA